MQMRCPYLLFAIREQICTVAIIRNRLALVTFLFAKGRARIYCRLGDGHSERFVHATTRPHDRGDGGVNGATRTVEGIFVVISTRRLALEGEGALFRSAIFDAG